MVCQTDEAKLVRAREIPPISKRLKPLVAVRFPCATFPPRLSQTDESLPSRE
jgi:hypothetical protein